MKPEFALTLLGVVVSALGVLFAWLTYRQTSKREQPRHTPVSMLVLETYIAEPSDLPGHRSRAR